MDGLVSYHISSINRVLIVIVCKWWYSNKPQLFWLKGSTAISGIPLGCAIVQLMPESASI
jgi:hypothetical protein